MSVIEILDHIERECVHRLSNAVSMQSISCDPKYAGEINKMVVYVKSLLETLGMDVELLTNDDDQPPLIVGSLNAGHNRSVLFITHYDVQPACESDGWNTHPFELVNDNGIVYGRGATDDKGPLIAIINGIEACKTQGMLPINIKFICEGSEESGSPGLNILLERLHSKGFFTGVHFICVCDSCWLGNTTPCVAYGLRGCVEFAVTVEGVRQEVWQ